MWGARLLVTAIVLAAGIAFPTGAHAFGTLGGDLRISFMGPNGNTNFRATVPSVAYNSIENEYLVVWRGDDNTAPLVDNEHEIFAQRLSAGGVQIGGRVRVSDMGPDGNANYHGLGPSVVYSPTSNEYLVVWMGEDNAGALVDEEFEIYGQRLDRLGAEVGANDFRISDMGPDGNADFDAHNPAVAHNQVSNEYLVVWDGDDNTGTLVDGELEVFGQRLSSIGSELGANDFRISDMGPDGNTSYGVAATDVAHSAADDQYLVVWDGNDNVAPLVQGEREIFGQRLTGAGVEGGANDFRISDAGPNGSALFAANSPSVAHSPAANEFLVAWEADEDTAPLVDDEFEIFGQRVDRTGAEVGTNDFRISGMGPDGSTSFSAAQPAVVARSAGGYFVVWAGDDNTAPLVDDEFEIFGQRLSASGAELAPDDLRISDMGPDGNTSYGASSSTALAYNSSANEYFPVWPGDDDTAPLVDDEREIFGRRVGEPVPPPGGGGGPGGGGPPGGGDPPPADPPAFGTDTAVTLALAARRVGARGPVRVRVANANGFQVTGRLSARTAKRIRGRRVRLRSVAFDVAAGSRRTVALRLPRSLRRVLARSRKLQLTLTATLRDPAGNARTVTRRLTVRLKRPRRR